MLPDCAVAGPEMVRLMSAPCVTVVDWETSLFCGWRSPSMGTNASTVIVPGVLVRTLARSVAASPPASAGRLQVTVAGPLAGTGAQPVIVSPALPPSKMALAGIVRRTVLAGAVAVARSSFRTVTV